MLAACPLPSGKHCDLCNTGHVQSADRHRVFLGLFVCARNNMRDNAAQRPQTPRARLALRGGAHAQHPDSLDQLTRQSP